MTDRQILDGLERVLKAKECVEIAYDEGGSGMGFYFQANADGWPWCSSGTLRDEIGRASCRERVCHCV